MPVYLDEDMIGTDPATVGFPHVLLCMAVVGMTEHNLYGVHLGEIPSTNATIDGFRTWLGALGVGGGDFRALYGSANFGIRYQSVSGPNSDLTRLWKVEMNRIAGRLGYRGPTYGFDTSVIAPANGTYLEFRSQQPRATCRIFYKRNEKMQYTSQQMNNGAPSMAKVNLGNGQVEPAVFVRTSASVAPASTLNEVDYSARLVSYFLA